MHLHLSRPRVLPQRRIGGAAGAEGRHHRGVAQAAGARRLGVCGGRRVPHVPHAQGAKSPHDVRVRVRASMHAFMRAPASELACAYTRACVATAFVCPHVPRGKSALPSRLGFACRTRAGHLPHLHRGLGSPLPTSAPGTGLAPPTSAPGLGSPLPHLHRDWALEPA